jgi:Flp pilus assembly pilin Flp
VLGRRLRGEAGGTASEFGVVLTVITVGIVGTLTLIADWVKQEFVRVAAVSRGS